MQIIFQTSNNFRNFQGVTGFTYFAELYAPCHHPLFPSSDYEPPKQQTLLIWSDIFWFLIVSRKKVEMKNSLFTAEWNPCGEPERCQTKSVSKPPEKPKPNETIEVMFTIG